VVLVHHHWDVRVHFGGCDDQVTQERLACIRTRTGRTLHDDWAVAGIRSLHDRVNLFHVVHVESRHAIAVFCSMVEKLAH
jgi:hypothetical protein